MSRQSNKSERVRWIYFSLYYIDLTQYEIYDKINSLVHPDLYSVLVKTQDFDTRVQAGLWFISDMNDWKIRKW